MEILKTLTGKKYLCINMTAGHLAVTHQQGALSASEFRLYATYNLPVDTTGPIDLYQHLGFDVMRTRVPVVYLVDDLMFATDHLNADWWRRRANKEDVVVDGHGQVLQATDIGTGSIQ